MISFRSAASALLVLGGIALAPSPARAQGAGLLGEPGDRWLLTYIPFLRSAPNDFPEIAFRVRLWQPASWDSRVTARGEATFEAGTSFRGSRYISGEFRAPELVEGWRFRAYAAAVRDARFGYNGLGNSTSNDQAVVKAGAPFFYRVHRTRYFGRVEVTRQIRGPLLLSVAGFAEQAHFTDLPGPDRFTNDFGEELKQGDVSGRAALVLDTRDNEYDTHRGLLLEAGAQVGSGGDGYHRFYGVARGWLPVREGTVVAARLAASNLGGTPPLDARFVLPTYDQELTVYGGPESNRGLDAGRYAGTGVTFGNLEVHHDIINLGVYGALTAVAFVDAGRVFEATKGDDFRITTDHLKTGYGLGLAARLLRSTIFVFNFAGGSDGFNFSFGSGWMF